MTRRGTRKALVRNRHSTHACVASVTSPSGTETDLYRPSRYSNFPAPISNRNPRNHAIQLRPTPKAMRPKIFPPGLRSAIIATARIIQIPARTMYELIAARAESATEMFLPGFISFFQRQYELLPLWTKITEYCGSNCPCCRSLAKCVLIILSLNHAPRSTRTYSIYGFILTFCKELPENL